MTTIHFTPEQNDRLNQAFIESLESSWRWELFLARVKECTDEQTVLEVLAFEARLRSEQMTDEVIGTEMGRIFEDGLRRKLVDKFVAGFMESLELEATKGDRE